MIRNYFKVAWRNLFNNKIFSAINIFGLAAGMAVTLIIGLWVYHEYSYDKFLPDYKQIYQVQRNYASNGDTLTFKTTSLKLASMLRNEIPEIEYVAESDWMAGHGLMVGDKKFFLYGGTVNEDFLKMFGYPLLTGNATQVLKDPHSIVLTESLAKILFGNEDALNKTVRIDNQADMKVTGILKDLPANSSFQFKYLVPFSYYESLYPDLDRDRFDQNAYQIFVKLKPGISYAQVAPKIRLIEHIDKESVNAMNSYVIMQPMANWHLYGNYVNGQETGGYVEYVRLFTIIGILVLLIACINFINLTTARSERRAREVGIRKAIGSERRQLIVQFLAESFFMSFIAFLFSLLLVQLALPAFNTLTGSQVAIPYGNPVFWICLLLFVVLTALMAGSRPAFYLSSFNPVKVLKGTVVAGPGAAISRKALVVLQFSCSVVLIVSTFVVYRQIQYAKNRPTGLELNSLMQTDMNEGLKRNYTALKNELERKGIITSMTSASSPATDLWWHSDVDQFKGKQAGETVEMGVILTGPDYFKTLGMELNEGRNFSSENDSGSVIINQAAVKRLRLENPVSQQVNFQGREFTIVGVVKDALMISPFAAADPTFFFITPDRHGSLMYRLSPGISAAQAMTQLTEAFNRYSPAFPYDYRFADASYAAKFKLENLIGRLAAIFAGLAVFISCLGLFGLVAYVAERRTKEIGVRKVLGASVAQIWLMLSKEFILLVLLSCIIAAPVAFYFLKNWLDKYSYRIDIGADVFIIATVLAILLTVITVSFQAIKAGLANPVRSLRAE